MVAIPAYQLLRIKVRESFKSFSIILEENLLEILLAYDIIIAFLIPFVLWKLHQELYKIQFYPKFLMNVFPKAFILKQKILKLYLKKTSGGILDTVNSI